MKHTVLLFLIIASYSCKNSAQSITIPDKIEVSGLENKINVKGTRVIINKSNDYKYIDELKRFHKDAKNYFQVVEVLDQDFTTLLAKVSGKIDELESQGGTLRVKKKLKLDVYDAYFALAPQDEASEQIIFAFGDATFSVMVMGVFQNNDKERKEITDLVLSTYYDKNIKADVKDNLFYTVDLSHSKFKLATVMSVFGTYTLDGENLSGDGMYATSFFIGTLPDNLSDFDLKTYSDKMIYKYQNTIYEEKRIQIKILSEKKYKEGENEIIKVEMLGTFKGKPLKLFQYIKQTPKGVIQFFGSDVSENYGYFEELKAIAERVKFK